ncbi:MAG: hydrogenase maturation protease [Bacteroidetes bacterium]|nr:hydrogenase maturation protease [Bacteroidales bacterium]MBU1008840.1 hydrogenase maturation protease [Bacteroidota bacterium]
MPHRKRMLIYGYGNPGRQDDGLGAAFIRKMEAWLKDHPMPGLNLDCNYQLNIEDAEIIAHKDIVIFVDATVEDIEHFHFSKVEPSAAKVEFTMHAVSPSFVVDLCRKMFHVAPETYLLHIKGYEWDFKESLSEAASENLEMAFRFIIDKLHGQLTFDEAVLQENK